MPTPDGNAIFAAAALTCVKGAVPRDGGTAIGVLSDWLQERIGEQKFVCVADPDVSGFCLCVMFSLADPDEPLSAAVLNMDDQEQVIARWADFGEEFRTWLAEAFRSLWS